MLSNAFEEMLELDDEALRRAVRMIGRTWLRLEQDNDHLSCYHEGTLKAAEVIILQHKEWAKHYQEEAI